LNENDVGVNRATASLKKLQELNPLVTLDAIDGELTKDRISKYRVVVSVGNSLDSDIQLNELCRQQTPSVHFIRVNVHGLFGGLFIDLGNEFIVQDIDGEVFFFFQIEKLIENLLIFFLATKNSNC